MKDSEFKFRVAADLKAHFIEACNRNDQPAAQVLRAYMRTYIDQEGEMQTAPSKPAKTSRKG